MYRPCHKLGIFRRRFLNVELHGSVTSDRNSRVVEDEVAPEEVSCQSCFGLHLLIIITDCSSHMYQPAACATALLMHCGIA
jgi:hypothetical protein